jgi:hypothetical protein
MRAGADPALKILNSGGYRPGHDRRRCDSGVMRYPDGGGLTAGRAE